MTSLSPTYILLNRENSDYKRFSSAKEAIFYFIREFAERFEDTLSSIGYILKDLTIENEAIMEKRINKRRKTLEIGCDLTKTNWKAARKYWFNLNMYEDFNDYVYEIENFETESYEMWMNRYKMISELEEKDLEFESDAYSYTIICSHRKDEQSKKKQSEEKQSEEIYGHCVIDPYYTQIKNNIENGLPINEKLPDYIAGAQHVLF